MSARQNSRTSTASSRNRTAAVYAALKQATTSPQLPYPNVTENSSSSLPRPRREVRRASVVRTPPTCSVGSALSRRSTPEPDSPRSVYPKAPGSFLWDGVEGWERPPGSSPALRPPVSRESQERKAAEQEPVRRPSGFLSGEAVLTPTPLSKIAKRLVFSAAKEPGHTSLLNFLFSPHDIDPDETQRKLIELDSQANSALFERFIISDLLDQKSTILPDQLEAAIRRIAEEQMAPGVRAERDPENVRKVRLLDRVCDRLLQLKREKTRDQFWLALRDRKSALEESESDERLTDEMHQAGEELAAWTGHFDAAVIREDTAGRILHVDMREADVHGVLKMPVNPKERNARGESLVECALNHGQVENAIFVAESGSPVFGRNASAAPSQLSTIKLSKQDLLVAIKSYEAYVASSVLKIYSDEAKRDPKNRKKILKAAEKSKQYKRFVALLKMPGDPKVSEVVRAMLLDPKSDFLVGIGRHFLMGMGHHFTGADTVAASRNLLERWSLRRLSLKLGILPKDDFKEANKWLMCIHGYAIENIHNSKGAAVLDQLYQLDAVTLRQSVEEFIDNPASSRMSVASSISAHTDRSRAAPGAGSFSGLNLLWTPKLSMSEQVAIEDETWDASVVHLMRRHFVSGSTHRGASLPAPMQAQMKGSRQGVAQAVRAELIALPITAPESGIPMGAASASWRADVLVAAMTSYERQYTGCFPFSYKSNYKVVKKLAMQAQHKMPFGEMLAVLFGSSGGWSDKSMKTCLLQALIGGEILIDCTGMNRQRLVSDLTDYLLDHHDIDEDNHPRSHALLTGLCREAMHNYGRRCRGDKAIQLMNMLYHMDFRDINHLQHRPADEQSQWHPQEIRDHKIHERLANSFCREADFGEHGKVDGAGRAAFRTSTVWSRTKQHNRVADLEFAQADVRERAPSMETVDLS